MFENVYKVISIILERKSPLGINLSLRATRHFLFNSALRQDKVFLL
jgi:hypothetical protein